MYNEMVQFPGGAIGIALNLEEDEVGCVVLGDISKLKEGDEVQTTGRLLSVPVGKALLGRVVDALGNPVDGKGPIAAKETYPVEKIAPGIIVRKSVSQPLHRHHGDRLDDPDRPRPARADHRRPRHGQDDHRDRHDHQQAKINKVGIASGDPKFRPVYSIYVAVGQKNSNIVRTIGALEAAGASNTPSSSPRPPPTIPPTSTSLRSPAPPWASGSWKTAWTR
jgi:F-type H+-transporting ATPase subunit alpha